MSYFVVLLALFGFTYGFMDFDDIYKGDANPPIYKNGDDPEKSGWILVDKDAEYNIKWYKREDDDFLQLAFDELKSLAGVRLAVPQIGITNKDFYKNSKIFKEETISDEPYYTATVIFSYPDLLKGKGRTTTKGDEIVQLIIVKNKDGTLQRIERDACDNAKPKIFIEQGCKNGYGLIFSPLNKDSPTCDYPFFLVYDVKKEITGDLIGLGWLVPASDITGSAAITDNDIKTLFPSAPDCVKGTTPVNIWLAKKARQYQTCDVPVGQFVQTRCQPKLRGGEDNDF